MLPTKEKLIEHLTDKMTNQDIAEIYGITFQKVIQLIKKYNLNQKELRKVEKQIVYEHWYEGHVCYVGSGSWSRMRRSSTRRNLDHKKLMEDRLIEYKVVKEFDTKEEARDYENKLIIRYRSLGQCEFNLKYNGVREEISNRGYTSKTSRRNKSKQIVVWKDGNYFGTYNYIIDFAREISKQPEKLLNGISLILHKDWRPLKGNLGGFEIKYKENS